MDKRGVRAQITIFLIFAVILLIVAGILFYIQKENSLKTPDITPLPTEALPVQRFIEGCLETIGSEAVINLGAKSGYIAIPDDIMNNPLRNLKFSEGFYLPYWYYDYKSQMPSKEFISGQIGSYVTDRISQCLDHFNSIEGLSVKAKSEPKASALINDDNVEITLNYQLEITSAKSKSLRNTFSASVPVRLGKILRLANEIMAKENLESYFEAKTIDIMAANKDIPFTDLAFSCVPLTWKEEDIKILTKQMLYADLPLIRVKNTQYRPFIEEESKYANPSGSPPQDMVEYAMFLWDPLDLDYPEMRIGFAYYPGWPMQFKAYPSTGGIMRTEKLQGSSFSTISLATYCIQFSHFAYDISYPIKVTVFDEKSFNSGYSFSFAFPVTIFKNTGIRNTEIPAEVDEENQEDFCSELGEQEYIVWARDSSTFNDIFDASIAYNCIKFECPLGKTDETGKLTVKLPSGCLHGILKAEKDSYLPSYIQTDSQTSILMDLKPLHELSLSIVKYNNETKITSQLSPGEKGIVYLKQKNTNYEAYGIYETGNEKIQLVDGKYDAEVYIYKGDELIGGYTGIIELPVNLYSASAIEFPGFYFEGKSQEDMVNLINEKRNSTEIITMLR